VVGLYSGGGLIFGGGAYSRRFTVAVKDLLLGKNVLAVLPTGYGKSLIFTLFLLARENITRINIQTAV
jgi:superfamily II DNA helicase RecQ